MTRRCTGCAAAVSVLILLAACTDATPPLAVEPPPLLLSVEPVLEDAIEATVITSSAFTGARPARETADLQPIAELPDGRLEGVVVHVGRGCETDAYLADPDGAIALIERGTCTFSEKIERALAAGAIGVIVYNFAGALEESLTGMLLNQPLHIAGVFVQRSTGLLLRDGSAPVTAVVRAGVLDNLEDAVQQLADAGLLSHGQTTALLKKLENAAKHVEKGNISGALGMLHSFIDHVAALVDSGVIAPEDGALLIEAAEALIAAIT